MNHAERTRIITNPRMDVVGMVFYLVSPSDTTIQSPIILDLMGFSTVNLAWVSFSGSITIGDLEPQTLKPVGTPISKSLSGSGEASPFFSSVTSLVSISLTGTPSSSAVSLFVF